MIHFKTDKDGCYRFLLFMTTPVNQWLIMDPLSHILN